MLAIHIAAAVGAFGVVLAGPLLGAAARRAGLPTAAALHRLQGGVVAQVVSWGGALVLAAGLYLTVDGPHDMSDPWVGATFAILIVLLGLSGAYLAPRERRLADLAEAGGGGDYDALARQVRMIGLVSAALVVVAVFLMVTKPGA